MTAPLRLRPFGGQDAAGLLAEVFDVRAVGAVDDHPPAARNEADDLVARDGVAAAGKAGQKSAHPLDDDAARIGRVAVIDGLFRDLFLIEVDQLEEDLIDGDRAVADGSKHLVLREEGEFFRDLGEALFGEDIGKVVAAVLGFQLEHAAADLDILVLHLAPEELLDLGAGAGRFDDLQPVPGGAAGVGGGNDLHHVARLQRRVELDDLGIDARPDAMVADLAVDGIGKVDRRRVFGQRDDLALRGKDEQLVGIQLGLERLHEILRVLQPALPVEHLADPGKAFGKGSVLRALFLVLPMRRDTELGRAVHLEGADLDLEGLAEVGDDRRVQRLVHIRLRRRDVVLDAAGDRLPALVDLAEHLVTLVHRADDDAHGGQVVDLVERFILRLHLFIDGIEVLRAAEYLPFDLALVEDVLDLLDDEIDEVVPLV